MQFGPYSLDYNPRLNLKNIKLELKDEITHLVGANGVGKSTVMNQMVKECVTKKINFSLISQDYRKNWLWWLSPIENLMLAWECDADLATKKISAENRVKLLTERNSSKQVNFEKQSEFETMQLSGGQLQRLILFREVERKPEILFLDEAFSALDKEMVPHTCQWLKLKQQEYGFWIVSISHGNQIVEKIPGKQLFFKLDEQKNLLIN